MMLASSALPSLAGQTAPHKLTGAQIRRQIIGKEITDGFHWRQAFLSNGVLKFVSLGHPERGSWRIEEDLLCTRTRLDGDACYEIWRNGDQIHFRITADVERYSGRLEPLRPK
jgi:hypothetical protein